MKLSELPRDLLGATLQFADHKSLLQLESVSRRLHDAIEQCATWQSLAQRYALYVKGCRTRNPEDWKRLVMLTLSPVGDQFSVLRQVRECSSTDHSNESAENTLTRSHCCVGVALLNNTVVADDPNAYEAFARRLQVECGCARGRPCYWSTASTWSCKTTDYLDYAMWENALVDSIQILPYRVFWYPGSPTYSPKRLSFALYELGVDGEDAMMVYESMEFSIVKDMKMQTFKLPCRVFLARGVLRVNLFDRQEEIGLEVAQWMQENNLPPYYTCLSYVGATGLLEAGLSA